MTTVTEVNCFNDGIATFMRRLKIDKEGFLDLDALALLNMTKDTKTDTAYYSLRNPHNKEDTLVFLVTKDKFLMDDLSMKKPKEARTTDLFDKDETPLNSSVRSLIKTFSIDETENNFVLDDNGTQYSFKVAYGVKANNVLINLDRYMDELECFKEAAISNENDPILQKNKVLGNISKLTQNNESTITKRTPN